MNVFWFLFGAFLGFDIALTYAWLTTRRARRSLVNRVLPYTNTLTFDTPTARQALKQKRKPW